MGSSLYSPPPPPRPLSDDKPTLLTSWWITLLCAVIILFRLLGRCVRVEKLFREDLYAAAALIPLFVRMAFVHPALLYGTNNVLFDGISPPSNVEIHRRSIASRLVLVSRLLHCAM
jgi:bacteriorhodopsin